MEVLLCLLFVAYLLPFAVAARHEHERLGLVLAANLLLGWTGIGWWLVLRWARRPARPAQEPVVLARRGHLRLLETGGGDGAAARPSARVRSRRANDAEERERPPSLRRPRA